MLKIGIIGVGGISGAHINGISKVPEKAVITAICDIDTDKLKAVGDKLGIPEEYRFENYIDLINCPEVDAVEICTPNYLHIPMAIDAAKAGKPVEVEKPLSTDYNGIDNLIDAVKASNVPNMICFSYRFKPAVRYAKDLISQDKLGKIVNVNVEYLKSSALWNGRELEWRFIKEYAGSGVLGDLGVHLIDMTRFLVGDFKSVCALTSIVVEERKKQNSSEIGKVETDDVTSFIAKLENDIIANFMITRCAIGNANTIKYEIYGTNGAILFNLNNPEEITLCINEGDVTKAELKTIPVPKEYFVDQEETFIDAAMGKKQAHFPDINEGAECQKIVDAVLESSETNSIINIK